jgi:hypothetical protein
MTFANPWRLRHYLEATIVQIMCHYAGRRQITHRVAGAPRDSFREILGNRD